MRTIKKTMTLFLFLAAFSSYNTVFAETAETSDHATAEHHTQTSLDLTNVYQGFLPCDDCKGIKTSLALSKSNNYILLTQFVGKSDKELVEKGKFVWGSQGNSIVLTPRNNTETRHYSVGEGTLTQLDNQGEAITGKLADRYVLHSIKATPPKATTSHH